MFAPQRLAPGDHVGQRRTVFPFQPLQQRQPVFDLLQAGRRGFNRVGVAAEKSGQILELRLDAVARVEIRLEARIEAGELRDTAPDLSERGQNGIVALVQCRVAVGAQPLDPLGIGEHLAHRAQLVVFAG